MLRFIGRLVYGYVVVQVIVFLITLCMLVHGGKA